MLTARV